MVLALSLPFDFPNRQLLITLTFGVVVLSILVQGLTMQPLLRRVGLALNGDSA
jgi:monovalent cation:H+ antiporter, CPA1 family